MDPRASIDVFGKKIRIKRRPLKQYGILGRFIADKKLIELDDSIADEEMLHTAVHEMMHAVFWRIGLQQCFGHEAEEILCESIATFMIENFDFRL